METAQSISETYSRHFDVFGSLGIGMVHLGLSRNDYENLGAFWELHSFGSRSVFYCISCNTNVSTCDISISFSLMRHTVAEAKQFKEKYVVSHSHIKYTGWSECKFFIAVVFSTFLA
jgi:hypothetical protein